MKGYPPSHHPLSLIFILGIILVEQVADLHQQKQISDLLYFFIVSQDRLG